jgi:hypothetical protein
MKPLGLHLRHHPAARAWTRLLPLIAPFLTALTVFAVTLRSLAWSVPEARGAGAPAATETPAGARGPATMERFVATVKAVDLSRGTIDLVTGVGLSLRIHRVHLPTPLKVKGAAPESAAAALTRGCIVRVECHATSAGTYASTVELVRPALRGVKP